MKLEDLNKKPCPACKGNGYIRLTFETEKATQECQTCESQGEIWVRRVPRSVVQEQGEKKQIH
jgi:DnaJ-class molecular chaperone